MGYKTNLQEEVIPQGPSTPALPLLNVAVDELNSWFRGKENGNVAIDFCPP